MRIYIYICAARACLEAVVSDVGPVGSITMKAAVLCYVCYAMLCYAMVY